MRIRLETTGEFIHLCLLTRRRRRREEGGGE